MRVNVGSRRGRTSISISFTIRAKSCIPKTIISPDLLKSMGVNGQILARHALCTDCCVAIAAAFESSCPRRALSPFPHCATMDSSYSKLKLTEHEGKKRCGHSSMSMVDGLLSK